MNITAPQQQRPTTTTSNRTRHSLIRALTVAIIAASWLVWAVAAQAQRPQARPVDGVDAIIDTFKRFPVIAIGEDHGNVAQHVFLRKLVSDPRFSRTADAVVIEAGSARHQQIVDRFIAGKRVSRSALAASWRDSIGGGHLATWDAPIYEQFLRTIRRANRGRPARHRLRVLLGDPPVHWNQVRRAKDLKRWAPRDQHYASVVDRHVLRHGKRALLIAGVFHFHRDTNAPAKSALLHIDEQHPGKTYHVTLPPFDAAAEFGAAFDYTRSFPADSLVPIDGTDLGALRQRRRPGAPEAPTQEENGEAWFIPDPAKAGLFSNPYPTVFEDRWWNELQRRNRLEGFTGTLTELFTVRCSYCSIQGRGLRQAVRVRPASGEPLPAGSSAIGQAPQASDAAAEIVAQLAAGKVVAIGDATGLEQQHEFLRKLIASGQLPGKQPVIIVGFGNSRYQPLIDAYLAGKSASLALVAGAWQNTSQLLAYDAPPYEQFFTAVRAANAKLPADKRIRVMLGEPPLDWATADSPRTVHKVAARRAAFMAGLVKRHVRQPGKECPRRGRPSPRRPGPRIDRRPAAEGKKLGPGAVRRLRRPPRDARGAARERGRSHRPGDPRQLAARPAIRRKRVPSPARARARAERRRAPLPGRRQ